MNRDKYDGKLTDALINTVIHAELRQWVREVKASEDVPTPGDLTTGLLGGKKPCCGRPLTGHEYACVNRERPTDAELAAAWVRDHGDDDC